MKLPKAKIDNTVVQILSGETMIYNLTTNQAFRLNETAAKVFNACDGEINFAELKAKNQLTDEIIYLALKNLLKQNLLERDFTSPFAEMSRRELIRRVGLPSSASVFSGCSKTNLLKFIRLIRDHTFYAKSSARLMLRKAEAENIFRFRFLFSLSNSEI